MISSWILSSIMLLLPCGAMSYGESVDDDRYGLAEAQPRRDGAVRVATYNIENVFDHADDPDLQGEFDDAELGISESRARAIADAIRKVDADILAVQEIESLEALTWFRDTYLQGLGYDHVISHDVGYYRGIEQGILSRFPIVESEVRPNASLEDVERPGVGWAEEPKNSRDQETVQRSPLRVKIRVNDEYELTLFVLHHKAGNSNWKREAEAIKNLEWIDETRAENPSANIIVLGDFNCAPWSKSIRVYLAAGFVDVMHFRTVSKSSAEHRTFKSHRSNRVIDFVLMNAPAYNEYIVGSAHIFGTFNPPSSWNWRTDPYPEGYASDHYPVIVDIYAAERN